MKLRILCISVGAAILLALFWVFALAPFLEFSRRYQEAEHYFLHSAGALSDEIQKYHDTSGKWPATLADIPNFKPATESIEFFPDEKYKLACRVLINSQNQVLIHKSGQIEIAETSRPIR